jgi:CheY-like chemotaxis protein
MSAAAAEISKEGRVSAPILVVDDDPSILDVVTMTLEFEGYTAQTALDGAEALEVIERGKPALVLLDMRMPGMDGWTFARELRSRGLDIPIVVMTAAQDARRWAEEIGADAYVEKPFELSKLIGTVSELLGG